ncbi:MULTISPECIES: DUF1816 domain-containing protein [unclassified Nostoc]|uniref:DUF1816 domain-containing protein n=1 Tax=unclassified Nostoc TaxID=2593658 RepID=UPI0028C430E1|nr:MULTISPECIES: DUF1816 domain-containing protein [unclassified Nostoc]
MFNKIKFFFTGFIQGLKSDYWAEVTTQCPYCIYYFGPFQTFLEAKTACPGYVDDLQSEGALGIKVAVKRCNPDVLTIFEEQA